MVALVRPSSAEPDMSPTATRDAVPPILVEVSRGDMVESRHRGSVAVVDAKGGIVLALGDIEAPVYARSAIKPLQALPLIESGAADRYELGQRQLALSCASMGMLVFGTLHTNNAPKTIDRIINTFPAEEQNQVRVMLAGCLSGVVAQLLCKKIPKGRVAVHEILLQHEALPNTIRSGQIANVRGIIESGAADGMITMDNSLMARVKDGTVEPKEAYMKGANKALFAPLLKPGDLDSAH